MKQTGPGKSFDPAILNASEWFTTLAASIPDHLFVLDPTGTYCFSNGHLDHVGQPYSRNLVGKTLRDIYTPALASEYSGNLQAVLHTGQPVEFRHEQVVEGQVFHHYDKLFPIRDAGGRVVAVGGICRDVTEQWTAQHDYAELFDSMLSGCALHEILCDASGKPVDYRFLRVNRAFERLTGLTADQVLGRRVLEVMPQTEAVWIERYGRVALTGQPVQFEEYAAAIGRWFQISAYCPASGQFACIFEDITARKQAEREALESRMLLSRAQEIAHVGSWEMDLKSGRLTWSDEVYRIFGFSPHAFEATYEAFLSAVHPDDRRAVDESYTDSIQNPSPGYAIQHRIIRRDSGEIRFVHERCEHVRDCEGHVVRSIGMVQDITDVHLAAMDREATVNVLNLINSSNDRHELLKNVLVFLKHWSGCEAVGIRLQDGDDYPYFEVQGFPVEFVRAENCLCEYDHAGHVVRDAVGNPVLECMCGNVLRGRFDPSKPFFTGYGSFWSNGTTALLASTSEQDRQARTRNRCNGEGYESVALIPLKSGSTVFGLIQLNDKRCDRFTSEQIALLERLADSVAKGLSEKMAREALRDTETRQRAMISNIADVIAIVDADGINRYKSPNVERWFGWRPEELVGVSTWDNVHPDEIPAAKVFFGSLLEKPGNSGTAECRYRCKDGSYKWIEFTATNRTDDPNIAGVLLNYHDISARKRAETELRESDQRVRRKLESLIEPEGDIGALGLADLLDMASMQALMDQHFAVTGMGVAILEANGTVLVATGWQDICTQFHRKNPQTCVNCVESDTILSRGTEAGDFKLYRCKNSMWDIATPIMIGNKHVGSLFLGQFFFDDEVVDEDQFRAQARQYGFDEAEYLAALRRVPRWSRAKVDACMRFYSRLIHEISMMGFGNVKLARAIAERESLLESLKDSQNRWQFALEGSGDGVWDWNAVTNRVYFSPRWKTMLGYEEAEIGDALSEWDSRVHPDDKPGAYAALDRHFKGELPVYVNEHRLRCKDGSYKWILDRGKVMTWTADGKPLRVIGVHTDISERKRMEAAQRQMDQQLQHTQKLESLGLLAGGIAHDFNNLLMAITGNLELALIDMPENSDVRRLVEQAFSAAERSAGLARQMLAYSGKGTFVVRPLDLSALVEANLALFRASIPRTIDLRLLLEKSLPIVRGDATQVEQVVMNLVTNAAEAMGGKPGTLTVRTGVESYDSVQLAASPIVDKPAPGCFVYVEVSDAGCGMDTVTLQRMFDPFYSSKAVGRGLGMPVVMGVIRGHGGAIFVESVLGKGTTIRVLFPLEMASEETARLTEVPVPADRQLALPGRNLVLLADDEETLRILGRRALKRMGFDVLLAADGREAVDLFNQHADQVGWVVLDLSMPQMDGLEALRHIRARHAEVPVILASGYSEQDMRERNIDLQRVTFLQKPYRYEALRDLMKPA